MPTLKLLVRKIFPHALEAATARHRDEDTLSAATPNGTKNNNNNSRRKPSRTLETGLTTFGEGEWDEESLGVSGRGNSSPTGDDPNNGSGLCKPRPKSIIRWSILSLPPRLTIPTKLSDFSDLSGYIRQHDEGEVHEQEDGRIMIQKPRPTKDRRQSSSQQLQHDQQQ